MHADNGGVDHLDSSIMGSGKCVYDAAPDTSPPPADDTVIAGRVRTKMIRQIAPRCPGSQDPEDAVEDTSVVYPRNATRPIRQHGLDGSPFTIREFVAHGSSPQFGSLNHGGLAESNLSRSPWRFGAEADINQPTTPAETVENDPQKTFSVRLCERPDSKSQPSFHLDLWHSHTSNRSPDVYFQKQVRVGHILV